MDDLYNQVLSAVRGILTPAGGAQPQKAEGDPWKVRQKFRQLTDSKFADSLQVLAGKPSKTVLTELPAGMLGRYSGPIPGVASPSINRDTLYLSEALFQRSVGDAPAENPDEYRRQPEYALAHEMGHRLEATELARGDFSMANQLQAILESAINDAATRKIPGPTGYWAQDGMEHYAEAFAQAITVLRRTAKDATDAPATIERAESAVPGTKVMLQKLLAQPIYEKHPLRKQAK